jgi:DNA processing protein
LSEQPNEIELNAWLTIVRTPSVGPMIGEQLIQQFGSPEQVLAGSRSALANAGLKPAAIEFICGANNDAIAADLDWLAKDKNHILCQSDQRYPSRLKSISGAPLLLYIHGDPETLLAPQLGMVGSRSPTPAGRDNAHEFAKTMARSGFVVTSGLAGGVDAAAHQGALAANGLTIAVCGTGLDRVYPASNRTLAYEIAREGALVSEFPIGTAANAGNFPRRNRIISALSLGVLVVEAALKSGSLITARHASEQGREVFAIPGSIHNPLARGCHALISNGAKLVESAEDIIEELASYIPEAREQLSQSENQVIPQENTVLGASSFAVRVFEALGFEPVSPDNLTEQLNSNAQTVSAALLELELLGAAASDENGFYQRLSVK